MQVAGLVTTIRYPEQNTLNISCWNTSQIQIHNISVQEEETTCRQNPCVLNSKDTQTIDDNCNGVNSCLVDYNFTSSCLRESRYVNLSYTCKHENGTRESTFQNDFGDWMTVSSINSTWQRNNVLFDHTGTKDYSLAAFSYSGRAGTARLYTKNEFTEPICLSLWYRFYRNTYDCTFSIYRITDENHTLRFTVDGNHTLFNTWINKSVAVYGHGPFKIALEANFIQRNSTAVRTILIDDTSIAYRPCEDTSQTTSHVERSAVSSTHVDGSYKILIE
ncbi:Hypothetical predicted protein [Mytilus galloprovincialis]|nr:Hypothetical predicted protein [Mytilus galloprovincialis]